jgi:hypothetical protein
MYFLQQQPIEKRYQGDLATNFIFTSIGARFVEDSMERDERASSVGLEPGASELESVGMISHPTKGSSFEAKHPAQFEMWQNVWI